MMKLSFKHKPFSLHSELAALLCLLLALGAFCAWLTPAITPKRHDYGAVWGMYLEEPEHSLDVMFFGSSLAYCDVVPALLYEDTGATSFVMAGPAQSLPVTYRYLRESCKTQSPHTVFIEFSQPSGVFEGKESQFIKVNLTYMPYSWERLIPVMEETAGAERLGLLFPPYAYHDRWDKLTAADWQGYAPDPLAGYTFLDEVRPAGAVFPTASLPEEDPDSYAYSLGYARKMVDFCREQGITPVFYLTPTVKQAPAPWRARIAADLAGMGVAFIDFNDEFAAIGLDLSLDFYDASHFNYRGAVKFTHCLANRLEGYLTPAAPADPTLWQGRVEHFHRLCKEADAAPVQYPAEDKEG